MGFWANVLSTVLNAVVTVGAAVVGVTQSAVQRIVSEAERTYKVVRDAIQQDRRPPPASERERIERDLEDVNQRVVRLQQRYRQAGGFSGHDQKEWHHLKSRREDLLAELEKLDKINLAAEIVEQTDQFEQCQIDDQLSHVLQYYVGQNVLRKACSSCGRPMVLQWERGLVVVGVGEFFWGCSGYYFKKCNNTEKLTPDDLRLFAKLKRPEFELTREELGEIITGGGAHKVEQAMRDIKQQHRNPGRRSREYRCPIHGERLVLREGRNVNAGLLDQFFLGCPRWLPQDRGCNFLVKLKSPAQLSAFLESNKEGGLIAVVGASAVMTRGSSPPTWTDREDVLLIRGGEVGVSAVQLAIMLGRQTADVEARIQQIGRPALAQHAPA